MYVKLHSLLKPEGELALIDVFAGQENGQDDVAIFGLESGLRTGGQICDAPRMEYSLKGKRLPTGSVRVVTLRAAFVWADVGHTLTGGCGVSPQCLRSQLRRDTAATKV